MLLILKYYHLEGCFNVGGRDFCIFTNTLIGCISWFGGSISANSIRVMPARNSTIELLNLNYLPLLNVNGKLAKRDLLKCKMHNLAIYHNKFILKLLVKQWWKYSGITYVMQQFKAEKLNKLWVGSGKWDHINTSKWA